MCAVYFVFFQAEDGIRDLVRSRGLGDVYKRQLVQFLSTASDQDVARIRPLELAAKFNVPEDAMILSLIHI